MTKKELIEVMKDLDDDAEIFIFCQSDDMGVEEYSSNIYFDDKITGDDVINEITIVACF